jgi:Tol biopolymer transport system component
MRHAWIIVVAAACGDDGATPDARPDVLVQRCEQSAPFQAPAPVAGLNTTMDDVSARLTPDELTVVFARRATNGLYDMYTASRASSNDGFGTPTLLATVNSINSELYPTLSPDGLLLVFDSDRGTNVQRVWVSKRASTSDNFGAATAAVALMEKETQPMLANGRALYFTSDARMPATGMRDIWRTEIDSTGATSVPTGVLGGVNTAADELSPTVTTDELKMFFARKTGAESDVYLASRVATSGPFGDASPVLGLAVTGVDETPSWIAPDGCALYLHMTAPGGMGGADIYVAKRGNL